MHHLVKLSPLLLGVASLSACSALGLGGAQKKIASHSYQSGQYTQVASNTNTGTLSDYDLNSGWYASHSNPYAGGQVQIDIDPSATLQSGATTQMAHTGYHDAYGNPVSAQGGNYGAGGMHSGRVDTTYVKPSLRGSYGPSYYGNIGGIMYDVDDELFGIVGRLGVQKEWYGAEIEGSFGIIDEDIDDDTSFGVDHSLAAFAVGRMPLSKRLEALGRIGYHTTQVGVMADVDGSTVSVSDDFDGLAYGAGLEYDIDGVNGIRLDYTRYDLGDDLISDSLAATYLRRF